MTRPLLEPTYTVSELCGEVRDLLGEAFASVWVVGEVQRLRPNARGHLYFELVEKGERDEITGKLDAVIWKGDAQRVQKVLAASDQKLAEGTQIRCRASLDFWAPGGRLQLCVREVDPVFTLGLLERRRRETLAALAAAGLLDRNRALPLSDLPLSIALITSEGSAAYHDFLSCLRESGYGFRVLFLHAAVQGRDAEREVVSAFKTIDTISSLAAGPENSGGLAIDCAVLIRGGGARSDLAAFDSRAIAEAVARATLPVLTGLGHEIDQSIADLVAHTALKTPTKASEFLIDRVRQQELRLLELRRRLLREAAEPLRAGREALGRAARGLELARLRVVHTRARLDELARALGRQGKSGLRQAERRPNELAGRLEEAARRALTRSEDRRRRAGERIAALARSRVQVADARIDGLARLALQLAPERTLERGFSITRDGDGRLVRRPDQVAPGDRLTTRLAGGDLTSRVEPT
ncbi:MAG TPA: exodeoxyribonuclease VII large subunit [Thermoanaerobaculia bacterium]|nr:exodeoxyribonuclease VII large subunit [Thermoanaerobaculia bacterium]